MKCIMWIPVSSITYRFSVRTLRNVFVAACNLIVGVHLYAAQPAISGGAIEQFFVRRWSTAEGLPHNVINSLIFDARQYLWIGTAGGLSRFDGVEFKEYTLEDRFRSGGYNIRALALDDKNELLLLPTSGDILRFPSGRAEVHPVSESVRNHIPKQIFQAPNGDLWVHCQDDLLFRWTPHGVESFGRDRGIPRAGGNATFAAGKNGEVWIALSGFVARFDGTTLTRDERLSKESPKISGGSGDVVWFCTPTRITKRSGSRDTIYTFADASIPPEPAITIQDVFEDRSGALWIAAGWHGLFRLQGDRVERIDTPPANVASVREDFDGNIWVGTNGNGLLQLRRKTHQLYNSNSGLAETVSQSVTLGRDGMVWIANQSGGLVSVHGSSVTRREIVFAGQRVAVNTAIIGQTGELWAGGPMGLFKGRLGEEFEKLPYPANGLNLLFQTKAGDTWFAGSNKEFGFYRNGVPRVFDQNDRYSGYTIRSIAENSNGEVWAGTFTGELYRFHESRLTRIDLGRPVHDILFDTNGTMWIATVNGLLRKSGDTLRTFTRAHGLADDMIQRLVDDGQGNLWFGSRRGLFYVPWQDIHALDNGTLAKVHSTPFGRDEGLAAITLLNNYFPSAVKDSAGNLWFATADGIIMVNPAPIFEAMPPPVYLDEAKVDDEPVPDFTRFRIPSGQHRVEIGFSVPSYSDPDAVRIRYKLEGADPDWKESIRVRAAVYSGLAPGTYRFKVLSGSSSGVWKEAEGNLTFRVEMSWWQRRWVLPASITLSALLGILAMRRWSQQVMRKRMAHIEHENAMQRELAALEKDNSLQRERARIARDLHDELGSSITAIGLLAERLRESSPPESAEDHELLKDGARNLGADLHSIVWLTGAQERSVKQFADYLRRYCARFLPVSVQCDISAHIVSDHQLAADVQHHLFAIVKESLNNALRHSEADRMRIILNSDDRGIEIMIEDNGRGFILDSIKANRGNGLTNIRERVAELGGNVLIETAPESGTRIEVSIPFSQPTRV